MKTLEAATDRIFRAYFKHCQKPDEDTLFNFLNALHSFNDKLKGHQPDGLWDAVGFQGLLALRNLFHHEVELLNQVRLITQFPQALSVELMRVCLVSAALVERAARGRNQTGKPSKEVLGAFNWYGAVVDIEPAIFNICVDAYEQIKALGAGPSSEAFALFEESYLYEELEGHPHRVEGKIFSLAGDVGQILKQIGEIGQSLSTPPKQEL